MFNRLTDKQCFQLLASLVIIIAIPAMFAFVAIVEWFFGETLMGLISVSFLGYMSYKAFQVINPDND